MRYVDGLWKTDRAAYFRRWRRMHPKQQRSYYLTRKAAGKPTGGGQPSRESKKRYLMKHPDNRALTILRPRLSARDNILNFFERRCNLCGYDKDTRALQLDHVNNDGKDDRVGVEKQWQEIQANPEAARKKYQILCANCHVIKTHETVWAAKRKRKIGGASLVDPCLERAGEEVLNVQPNAIT